MRVVAVGVLLQRPRDDTLTKLLVTDNNKEKLTVKKFVCYSWQQMKGNSSRLFYIANHVTFSKTRSSTSSEFCDVICTTNNSNELNKCPVSSRPPTKWNKTTAANVRVLSSTHINIKRITINGNECLLRFSQHSMSSGAMLT